MQFDQTPTPINDGNLDNSQKSFLIPLLIIVVLVIVGAAVYFYTTSGKDTKVTENEVQNDSEETRGEEIVSLPNEIPENFDTYESPIGFSVSYPENWTIKEMKGVDASFGGVTLLSPGSSMKNMYFSSDDKLEQLVSISAGVALQPLIFNEVVAYYKNSFEKDNQYLPRKVVDERIIQIDGTDAYEIVYTETDTRSKTSFSKIKIFMLADPTGLKNGKAYEELGTSIELMYIAKNEVFDRELAEQILGTFKESILKTYEKKTEEKRQAAIQEAATDNPQVKSALSNMRAIAELVYDGNKNSYQTLCSNGILNVSSDEDIKATVNLITSSLKVSSQKDAGIQCYSTKEKYVLSARISEDKFWCIDSNGTSKSGVADKAKLECLIAVESKTSVPILPKNTE